MKLFITISAVAIAAGFLLTMAPPAHADNAGAPVAGCQPGAGNDLMSNWQLLSLEEYAQLLVDSSKSEPTWDQALDRATATYAFCDKNGDNYACVMTQHLPNDANGSDTWFLIEDNHFPFGAN